MIEQILLVVLLVPLLWSAAIAGIRRWSGNATPDDRSEKYQLLIMVTPILLGVAWLAISRLMPVHLPLPLPPLAEGGTTEVTTRIAIQAFGPAKATTDPMPILIAVLAATWAAGALGLVLRLIISLIRLGHAVGHATHWQIDDIAVRLTATRLPPLAWGRTTILLPNSLVVAMSGDELRLILRHEQAHLRRKDPLYFATLGLLDAMMWFNPFLRAQTQHCRLAAELACDAAAFGKTPKEREAYAQVLIRTLKHTAGRVQPYVPAVISNVKSGDYRMRLTEIMHAAPTVRKPKRLWPYGALILALAPVTALQFAWAQGQGATSPAAVPATSAPPTANVSTSAFRSPVDAPISAAFGPRVNRKTGKIDFHQGVDFAVPVGTPVRAPADGEIASVATKWGYGKVVEIDHGHGLKTRLAHLDRQQVAVGDHVKAGQVVATSGNTGTTIVGPHLHFEVWKNGRPANPTTVLPKAG